MIPGDVEISTTTYTYNGEEILWLTVQICPRGVNDPIFGKPVVVVRISGVEYNGEDLGAICVQSHSGLQERGRISPLVYTAGVMLRKHKAETSPLVLRTHAAVRTLVHAKRNRRMHRGCTSLEIRLVGY